MFKTTLHLLRQNLALFFVLSSTSVIAGDCKDLLSVLVKNTKESSAGTIVTAIKDSAKKYIIDVKDEFMTHGWAGAYMGPRRIFLEPVDLMKNPRGIFFNPTDLRLNYLNQSATNRALLRVGSVDPFGNGVYFIKKGAQDEAVKKLAELGSAVLIEDIKYGAKAKLFLDSTKWTPAQSSQMNKIVDASSSVEDASKKLFDAGFTSSIVSGDVGHVLHFSPVENSVRALTGYINKFAKSVDASGKPIERRPTFVGDVVLKGILVGAPLHMAVEMKKGQKSDVHLLEDIKEDHVFSSVRRSIAQLEKEKAELEKPEKVTVEEKLQLAKEHVAQYHSGVAQVQEYRKIFTQQFSETTYTKAAALLAGIVKKDETVKAGQTPDEILKSGILSLTTMLKLQEESLKDTAPSAENEEVIKAASQMAFFWKEFSGNPHFSKFSKVINSKVKETNGQGAEIEKPFIDLTRADGIQKFQNVMIAQAELLIRSASINQSPKSTHYLDGDFIKARKSNDELKQSSLYQNVRLAVAMKRGTAKAPQSAEEIQKKVQSALALAGPGMNEEERLNLINRITQAEFAASVKEVKLSDADERYILQLLSHHEINLDLKKKLGLIPPDTSFHNFHESYPEQFAGLVVKRL